ncbi:MAG TPA: transferrin-binding protein-like solute binding protein [Acidobacteriaceae bacterium]|nr:transferrin-binding protein-like solute binding protein [Acidobacteriaceae bacterium]
MKGYAMATVAVTAISLSACGGGGQGVASIPPPPIKQPDSPSQLLVHATQDTEFTSIGSDIRIRWDESANQYEIMLPGAEWARLSSAGNELSILDANGDKTGSVFSGGTYSYTGLATVQPSGGSPSFFAYGIPTPQSEVPTVGSASYTAEFAGSGGGYSVGGLADLDFDFAAGTLTGSMKASANDTAGWGPYDLGTYDLHNTVYSSGSSTFSGALSRDGAAAGSFNGMFAGPQAQELMGQWQLLFQDFYAPDHTVNASGVFIGRRRP